MNSGRPILLLEADDETSAALVSILETDGFPVVAARSLFQAEEMARRIGPALLIVDLQLGQQMLDPMELEGLKRVARCPVVTMSHRNQVELTTGRYPSRSHLIRPVELDGLLAAVRTHYHVGLSGLTPVPPQAALTDSFQVELRAGVLWLSGQLDERTTPERMLEPLEPHRGATLKVDCASLRRVNSTGVRMWIEFLRALEKRGLQVTLRALSPTLVAQAKLIDGIVARCQVESFLCMVECPRCSRESYELVDTAGGVLPQSTCSCGGVSAPVDAPVAYEVLFAAAPPRSDRKAGTIE